MDLGTYERMLDQDLTRRNFVTAGQIYTEVLDRERARRIPRPRRADDSARDGRGEVQAFASSPMRGGQTAARDVVFVEVGGTVGDYENGFYIEALRELAFEEGRSSACFVALTYISTRRSSASRSRRRPSSASSDSWRPESSRTSSPVGRRSR